MRIELNLRKTARQNAALHYDASKEARAKLASLDEARARLERELSGLQARAERPPAAAVVRREVREREWFEKFKWFNTSGGRLCLAGKDARQNDDLFAHYMADGDLFFHADIQGAAFTLLKGGAAATQAEKLEAAQWAACNSSAWKRGFTTVDVYACLKEQLSKSSHGEFVGKGAFVMSGKREWFKNTELAVAAGVDSGNNLAVVPKLLDASLSKKIALHPGDKKTNARQAAAALGIDATGVEKLMVLLP